MATTEAPSRPHDRHGRRRPFANWMKRLANLKNLSSSDSPANSSSHKHRNSTATTKSKKSARNNPYPLSGTVYSPGVERANRHLSFTEPANSLHRSEFSRSESYIEGNDNPSPVAGRKSAAPTLSTNGDTVMSEIYSKAGTSATVGGGRSCRGGGEGSTFSSPAPSVRSLTTTLTTVQSGAPNHYITGGAHPTGHGGSQQTVQFTHQFPTTPVSAIPPHVTPHPTTYMTATANNLLTGQRLRAHTRVFVQAPPPKLSRHERINPCPCTVIYLQCRESLPLSVLSGNMGSINATQGGGGELATGTLGRGGMASGERASVYSASGVGIADRSSIRSGLQSHHARNDSATGSISGITANSYLPNGPGRISRRSSGWGEIPGSEDSEHDQEEDAKDDSDKIEGGDGKGQDKSN
ncbi:LOW QUALITY PROTEIN: hypothetical protein CIHG_06618 [Coccidioides immitis H538.4]|uniref:Uncharacterized protein n=1 Tax=Coccidioides immitis H538.4 TaxID=396776 RepID=A0A0J8UMB9_COCIT|nr:LOW QUALITY PROTEIN: hypothetical protein CIHG_06618 [Coccidioides immitis H538.4]